jgi:large subunit ribosomal protein L6
MSRIGKKAIDLPEKVKVTIGDDHKVVVEGPKGKLDFTLPAGISAKIDGKHLTVECGNEDRQTRAFHGLSRALINNMVTGVTTGFSKDLEIHGVGFKAALKGTNLDLNVGQSHDLLFPIPAGVKVTVTENTKLKVEGIDRQLVGQVASDIRSHYPPEPYKQKGIRYVGEKLIKKEGKTVQ